MTETYGSYFRTAHGSVHSGEGDQYNFHYYYRAAESRLRERAQRWPRSIAEEDRQHLEARFVPPQGLQQARTRLRSTQTVMIDGLPGSGRRSTAVLLLHELPGAAGSLHELPDTSDDGEASLLNREDVSEGDRLLLDLSEVEESRYVAVQDALSDFRDTVVRRGAHLAVVLPHHLAYLRRADLRHLTVEIDRPSPKRVFAVHLKQEGIVPAPEELGGTELTSFLTRAPLRDVGALADRVRRSRDVSPADRGFTDWLAESLRDQQDQTTRVAADLATERSGRERALMLSVAMFHGAAPDVVLKAANVLLGLFRHPPDPLPRLDRADLRAELSAIGADTGPEGNVRFRIAGYDHAVRRHFWTFLPDARSRLRDWIRECLTDPAVGGSAREEAVSRFAAEALRTERPEDLSQLVEEWMAVRSWSRLVPDAAQALAHGLDDDRHGRFFRQRVYDWATSTETSDRLREVLVAVCAQSMALSHPDQALVRLHHLARRSDGVAGARALGATLALARSDDRLYLRMLDRLSHGVGQGRWEADIRLFLELADPARLIGRPSVQHALAECWCHVLHRPAPFWTTAVQNWLTACEDLRLREPVLRVLAAACEADPHVSGPLYGLARTWLRAVPSGDRTDAVSRLLHKLDAAQGIGPYRNAV